MNKICTSIEQSQKLIKLGIDASTADMDYIQFANDPKVYDCVINIYNNEHEDDWIPAWSLSALLDILPYPTLAQHANELWSLTAWVGTVEPYSVDGYDNKIDACVEMIVKLNELKLL